MSRVIDVPIQDLPHIDEHGIGIWATDREVWGALLAVLPKVMDNRLGRRYGPLVGVEHPESKGKFGTIGSTLPGFVVSRSVPPAVLALLGEHRYSRYALIMRIEKTATGVTLRAETRADFPGRKGRAYKALVIDTRGHVVMVRRILKTVKKRAERASS